MGQVSTEQTVAIIEAVGEAVNQPEAANDPVNYWWFSLLLVIVPVILAPFVATWFQKRKQK
jgi:hypothetical protein